jgi:protein tyrosine phosphatase (PTP) superfamily phosphohydrolase (DUF442 family)
MPARALVCLLALCGALPLSAAADAVDDIINYRDYSALLSSAGQPNEDQLRSLADAGFERVVFLAFSDHEHSLPHEDRMVKDLGMEYVHIPVDWDAPRMNDFYLFAGAMQRAAAVKTLVHCQVNFRASTFSFLYRVLYLDVPVAEAKDAMNSVWVPNATWRNLIFEVLEDNGVEPDCDSCLWE